MGPLSTASNNPHLSRAWLWPFLLAIPVLLFCGTLAVLQHRRLAETATQIAAAAETGALESSLLLRGVEHRRLAQQATLAFAIFSLLAATALGVAAVALGRSIERRRQAMVEEAGLRQSEQKRGDEERAELLASERAARTEAERAARLQDEFVSTLSHELRTPLNAIVGWIGVLKQHQTPETLIKAIDVIDRNSRRQAQIVDDLLDVSRIMSGKLRLDVQGVELATVIESAVASAKPAADAKGVHLLTILGSAAPIQGDPGRLQQIVWNLVSNAIKFTPRGGMVQVTTGESDHDVQVTVSDTGQGIRPDLLPHIFQRFRQGDGSPTRQQGGLGLGLAIVKSLVEMHGGSLDVASDGEGHGSVFTVRLPRALEEARLAPAVASRPAQQAQLGALLTGVHVLVLDDEPDARDLVQRLIEDAGGEVEAASSARDAMDLLARGFAPDIILSDIGMPGEDGYDFMQRVRHMEGPVAGVPAAALTALARVEDRRKALMSGYQTHLAKPIDAAELVAMVASLTGRTGRVGV
jgi:hypothetical protein